MSLILIVVLFSVVGGVLVGTMMALTIGYHSKSRHTIFTAPTFDTKTDTGTDDFEDKFKYRKYGA